MTFGSFLKFMLCNKNTGWNSENVISSAALPNPILPSLNGHLILTTAEVNWSLICRHIFKQRLLFCKDYSASQSILFYSSHREAYAGLGRGAASCNSLSKGDKILSYTASVASHYIDLWQCYTFLQQRAQNIFFKCSSAPTIHDSWQDPHLFWLTVS